MKYLRVILIVLLLVCCTLWVASYWELTWISSDNRLVLQLWDGGFMVARFEREWALALAGYTVEYDGWAKGWWPVVWVYGSPPDRCILYGSFWLPSLLLAMSLAIPASPWARRRRRAKQGLCIRCGYDLSGTDHTLCPECGEEIRKAKPA